MPSSTTTQFGYLPEYSGVTPQGLNTVSGSNVESVTVSAAAMTGDEVGTAALLQGGFLQRHCGGSPRNFQLPTGVALAASMGMDPTGQAVHFILQNTSSGANAVTVTVNTGATIEGTPGVSQNKTKEFICVFTSPTEYRCISLGQETH